MRGSSLARQQRLVRLLDQGGGLSVPHAAGELGCTERTVYRDLVVLQEIGVPVYQEREGKRLRWRLVDGPRRLLSVTLSFAETLALTAGRDLLAGLAGTFFHEAAISALEKIRAALPAPLLTRADAAADLVVADKRPARDYRGRADAVRTLVDAIERRETVTIEYRKMGDRASSLRDVDPYHLHIHAGALYLIGWCHRRKAVRTFLLDRAGRVCPTGHTFDRRNDIKLAPLMQGDLGPWTGKAEIIRLRFRSTAARLVAEHKIHPSQVSELRLDAGLDVSLHAPITPWLERWLTGWAGEVEILSPTRLSDRVRANHSDALNRRRGPARARPEKKSSRRLTVLVGSGT
jgi:predicted DNA-binding transcriptional regulator YafY